MSSIPPDVALDAEYIPLDSALLCSDCSHIFRLSRHVCPACGSGSALSLFQVLNDKNEIVEALRAFSRLVALAKRPAKKPKPKPKEAPHEDPALKPGD